MLHTAYTIKFISDALAVTWVHQMKGLEVFIVHPLNKKHQFPSQIIATCDTMAYGLGSRN